MVTRRVTWVIGRDEQVLNPPPSQPLAELLIQGLRRAARVPSPKDLCTELHNFRATFRGFIDGQELIGLHQNAVEH